MEEDKILKLKQRILKILEKAEKTNHPAEAASLGEKARSMMEEHRISMADLTQAQDPMGRTMVLCPGKNAEYHHLATAVGYYFGCAVVYQKTLHPVRRKAVWGVTFVGRESARVTSELMFPFWIRECNRLGRKKYKEGFSTNPNKAGREIMLGLGVILVQQAKASKNELEEALEEVKNVAISTKAPKRASHEAYSIAKEVPIHMQVK